MRQYYKGSLKECQDIIAMIDVNCGFPSKGTETWAAPIETATKDVYVVTSPNGSHGLTKKVMSKGIVVEAITDIKFPKKTEII